MWLLSQPDVSEKIAFVFLVKIYFHCILAKSHLQIIQMLFSPPQMQFIDALDGEDLLLTGEVKWRPLVEENAQSILKVPTPTNNDAGL